ACQSAAGSLGRGGSWMLPYARGGVRREQRIALDHDQDPRRNLCKSALGRRERPPEGRRDLGELEPLDVAKDKGESMRRLELIEESVEAAERLAGVWVVVAGRALGQDPGRGQMEKAAYAAAPELGSGDVDGDADEERAQRGRIAQLSDAAKE